MREDTNGVLVECFPTKEYGNFYEYLCRFVEFLDQQGYIKEDLFKTEERLIDLKHNLEDWVGEDYAFYPVLFDEMNTVLKKRFDYTE